MNEQIIIDRLRALGLPVEYREFMGTELNPPPPPPRINWETVKVSKGPDGRESMLLEIGIIIKLYTARPEAELESRLEKEALHDVPYVKSTESIEAEDLYRTTYNIRILRKGSRT